MTIQEPLQPPAQDAHPIHQRALVENATCVLHIGAPKTGSTAIERFLVDNRASLAARGFLYPASIERGFGHHDLALLLSGGYPDWATPQDRTLDQLIEAVLAETRLAPEPAKLVLSSENFYWLTDPIAVRSALATLGHRAADTLVVLYVRPQERVVESWYNQIVKAQGYSGSFEQSIIDYDTLWDYESRIARWADAFTPEHLIIRIYPDDEQTELDVRRDFAGILGLGDSSLAYAEERPNQRLIRDLLEFQRTINRLPIGTIEKRRFHKQLIALSSMASTSLLEDAPLHTHETRTWVQERYEEGNRHVAARYFGRDTLFAGETQRHTSKPCQPVVLSMEKLSLIFSWILMSRPSDQ